MHTLSLKWNPEPKVVTVRYSTREFHETLTEGVRSLLYIDAFVLWMRHHTYFDYLMKRQAG